MSSFYLLLSISIIILSLDFILKGWKLLHEESEVLFFPERIGAYMSHILFGEKTTDTRKRVRSLPINRVRRGKWAFFGGVFCLLMGIGLLIEKVI